MTPVALSLLADLRAAGMEVALSRIPGKVHVQPLSVLTPARRQAILTHKADLVAALELEVRIRAMAARWQYTREELVWVLEDAQRNSAGWLACCKVDEDSAEIWRRARPGHHSSH